MNANTRNTILSRVHTLGILGALSAASFLAAFAANRPAELSITPDNTPFGSISQGAKVEATLTLHNGSQHVAVIDSVITSCACTAAQSLTKGTQLQPGETVQFDVHWNTEGKSGHASESVVVIYDWIDAERSIVGRDVSRAKLSAHVKAPYSISDRRLVIDASSGKASASLRVGTTDKSGVEVISAHVEHPEFSVVTKEETVRVTNVDVLFSPAGSQPSTRARYTGLKLHLEIRTASSTSSVSIPIVVRT